MFCSNYVEYWLIALAAWSCGGCVMPVNCELEPEHLEKQLSITKAKVIFKIKQMLNNFVFLLEFDEIFILLIFDEFWSVL